MEARISELTALSGAPDFWDVPERAQAMLKEQKDLETRFERLRMPMSALEDVAVLIELSEMEGDGSQEEELNSLIGSARAAIETFEFERMMSGEHDNADAILTINAGAGGTESQDWAEILYRMYLRYCERQGWQIEILDLQEADDAGIKSATIQVKGDYAYGLLRSESGVHRLVRISPFDSNARRHTSFSAVYVYPEIEDDIDIVVNESDLRVDTYRASGAGGQHINKTSSAVRIVHIPTGIVVACQAERSQHKNRDKAMKMLKARLYDLEVQQRTAERDALEATKQDNSFGSQIRNYVLHPYQLVKDLRSGHETSNVQAVLDGDLTPFIKSFLLIQGGANAPAGGAHAEP
jgi:peptide chain release factor 2